MTKQPNKKYMLKDGETHTEKLDETVIGVIKGKSLGEIAEEIGCKLCTLIGWIRSHETKAYVEIINKYAGTNITYRGYKQITREPIKVGE